MQSFKQYITEAEYQGKKVELGKLKDKGINHFIKKNKVFSYAITSTKTLSYTIFKKMNQNPING